MGSAPGDLARLLTTGVTGARSEASRAWQGLDERERIRLVMDYHRRARIALPNARLHAVFHVIVENQAALGSGTPVQATLERLQQEGLDRHDALHAVGSVLLTHIHDFMRAKGRGDPNPAYYRDLRALTARAWRRQGRL